MLSRNNAAFIGGAIESVFAQSYGRWELVIVENASNDGSREIIRRMAGRDHRVKTLDLETEAPLPRARNLGLARAAGDYIATIDADDSWRPDRLAVQVAFMEGEGQREVGVCGANCRLVREDGGLAGTKEFPREHAECLAALWYRNPFCHSATLGRRTVFEALGGYDESFEVSEDLELWFRAGRRFRFRNLPEYLVRYRIGSGSVTFRKHRLVVRNTLRARSLARRKYGYAIGPRERSALFATWLAQWLPPGVARLLFGLWLAGLRRPRGRPQGGEGPCGQPSEREAPTQGPAAGQAVGTASTEA
ncbi:MAG: glycosyltransferase family 2 protein [Limisphaerales bacterium]